VAAGTLTAVASAVLALAQTAHAQEAQTVTVTGIRGAIESAISAKKNSENIVEALSAEDIGKLPDTTVAESVARLPGVTAQRNKVTGRASSISVRGMSPDFNGATLNGREQASTGDSRGVEFDQFPAELLSQILIYKTPDAGLVGQGLSSTIDLRTVRPLDFGKRAVAVNYREQKTGIDSGAGEGKGDRFSLSYVDQFADRKLGIALGYTKSKDNGAAIQRFNSWGGWVTDVPYNGANVKTPGGFGSDTEQTLANREGMMAVLQLRPSKDTEISLDYFKSKGDFGTYKHGLEGPVGGLSAGGYDSGGTLRTATVAGGVASAGTIDNFRGVIRNHAEAYQDSLDSLGLNFKTKLGGWKAAADLSESKVSRNSERFETTAGLPKNVTNANDTISWTGFNGTDTSAVKYTTGLNYSDASLMKLTNVQGWGGGLQDGYIANPRVDDKIQAVRLSAKRDLGVGPLSTLELGINKTDRTKERTTVEGALVLVGSPKGADGKPLANSGFSVAMPNSYVTTAGSTGIPILAWNPIGSMGTVYEKAAWRDPDILAKNWKVSEEVTTSYVRSDMDGKLGGVEYKGNVGVQLVQTKQNSQGFNIDTSLCNGGTHTCVEVVSKGGKSYSDFLPSLNLNFDIGNDSVVRVGAAKVMARPNMSDMRSAFGFGFDNGENKFKGGGGNPQLEPFRATALDVSYEKYWGNKAYFAVAGFYKDLDSYIIQQGTPFDYAPYITANTTRPPGASTLGVLTKPVNGSGGSISGIELTASFPLGMVAKPLDGFGIQLTHSDTSSSIKPPTSGFSTNDVGVASLPLPGLSRQVTSLQFYYEKKGLQVRVAQRQRSDFLGEITDFQDNRQLTFIKGEAIVDFQIGYEFQRGLLKGLGVLFQASNLTNAEFQRYKEKPSNVIETVKYGKTYLFGINYKL
jgi:iron complex outermembrane receptor protein